MRYLRYLFLAVLGIVLLTVALANRAPVTVKLLPEELALFLGWAPQITLPLFLLIFAGIVAGLLIGFVWEWLREHKHRAEASRERRERQRLEREVKDLRQPAPGSSDEVLAILDSRKAAS